MNQMSVATFDTLAAVRNLEKAGVGTSQAEAITETIRVAVFQGVATSEELAELRAAQQSDLAELRAAQQSDIAEVRAELKSDLVELRAELKSDLVELRAELKSDIAEVKAETAELRTGLEALRADFEKLRADMTWRMMLVMGGLLALFTALDQLVLN